MMRRIEIRNERHGAKLLTARWCDSFVCRLRGLTFRSSLPAGEGLVLVESDASRLSSSIHMFAVFMPLGVLWLDQDQVVVDRVVAQPWRVYLPQLPARYIVEGPPGLLESAAVGDRLIFDDLD